MQISRTLFIFTCILKSKPLEESFKEDISKTIMVNHYFKKIVDSSLAQTKKVNSATTKDLDKPPKGKDSSNSFAFKDKAIVVNKSNLPARKRKMKGKKKLSYSGTLFHPSFLKDFLF